MRIHCPFCGERGLAEFTCFGEASRRRPDSDAPDAQDRLFESVYLQGNPAGLHEELWYHGSGCRSWLVVTRDTRTHEILAVDFMKQAASS